MSEIFDESKTFADLDFSDNVMRGVDDLGFKHPTHIQSTLIPLMLTGKDILGQAKTGTGKTAAFGLPLLQKIDPNAGTQAIILAPTRELAVQIVNELASLGKHTSITGVAVIGGASMKKQFDKIEQGAQIIVGTPGRIMDFDRKKLINFNKMKWVILDEVDRMLDIGFRDDIRKILSRIKNDHQTVFVSATIDHDIERLARHYMKKNVEKIVTKSNSLTVSLVTQKYIPVQGIDKIPMLIHLLKHEEPSLTLIFCRTKITVGKVSRYLNNHDIEAYEIHGDLPQKKRNRIMKRLRQGNLEVLVASDLAARGIDVEGITHIINYDLPEDPEIYVHRIGRTARAGRKGTAWSFVEPHQGQMFTEIEKLTGVLIKPLEYPEFKHSSPLSNNTDDSISTSKPLSRNITALYTTHTSDGTINKDLFPGGVVPKDPPRKSIGARFQTKRSRR